MELILKRTMPEILTRTEVILSRPYDSIKFSEFSPAYIFPTENISGYMEELNMEEKDVLTV